MLASGRLFTKDEMESGALVCVLGAKAAKELQAWVGSHITLDPQQGFRAPLQVIGVLQEIDESYLEEGHFVGENWGTSFPGTVRLPMRVHMVFSMLSFPRQACWRRLSVRSKKLSSLSQVAGLLNETSSITFKQAVSVTAPGPPR